MEPSISNLYLRIHTQNSILLFPLFGPKSNSYFQITDSIYLSQGNSHGVDYQLFLELHPNLPTWRYKVQVTNKTKEPIDYDLVYIQDIGICDYGGSRLNEFFVCHYIHHEPILTEDFGYGILSRQNESVSGKHPASFLFCTDFIQSFATDGLDLYPQGVYQSLPTKRRQGEHSILGLERKRGTLSADEMQETCFYGYLFEDLKTLKVSPELEGLIKEAGSGWTETPHLNGAMIQTQPSLFSTTKQKEGDTLTEVDIKSFFPKEWREVEKSSSGEILSFFTNESTHVVLKEKESLCLRPHGQILRTGIPTTPDESSLTVTSYFKGIFLSQLTEGHTSINQYISRNHSYLNFFHSYGFRIFREEESGFVLLDSPSLLSMEPNKMEWIYQWGEEVLRIQVETTKNHEIRFQLSTNNEQVKNFLLSFHIALDGDNGVLEIPPVVIQTESKIEIQPNPKSPLFQRLKGKGFQVETEGLKTWKVSDDRILFPDGISKNQPYLTAVVPVKSILQFYIKGNFGSSQAHEENKNHQRAIFHKTNLPKKTIQNLESKSLNQIKEILPWFEQNAQIHYLNPRGLEQYSGGGWGTRDVCQGAFEYLLAMGDMEFCRSLLLTVFTEQNEDGDWPQWFMLYPRDKEIRAGDSHGDILYWPLLALSTYLERTGDLNFLEEKTTGFHRKEPRTILEAVEKTISLINKRLVDGTKLPIYGNGDWNDSLQPVKEEFRTHAVSTWTAELQSLTYDALIQIYHLTGDIEKEKLYQNELGIIKQNIKEYCMDDGILTGLRYFGEKNSLEFYLHPKDSKTGIHYSILPMIYGILSEVLDSKEAETHLSIIQNKLTGQDGVRLFDAPIPYSDGLSVEFKRAETASYFGREIGLMYTHAHLRYCEALAHMGKSEEFFYNLNLINPIGIQNKVPASNPRQSNCYYSSSDGSFLDRYDAGTNYKELLLGNIPLEGGWRVYSSGPGIYIKLVYECLFGIRIFLDGLELNPTLPKGLDGLQWEIHLLGKKVLITYLVESENASINSVTLNGISLPLERKKNRYRNGAAKVKFTDLEFSLKEDSNQLVILLR
ncbi:hypothetical protein EHQ68_11905 [Leptospira congkakensis]|uniref:Uncharacterized protein n=2 Tax=Leptospira congkakensis TaxID=2484932 RepID=A0A4Z1A5B2_9LEPT|nr:hypothetical protein EHQ68_11905 [Leptospira congkakensis]TGL96970.1 hypothetical protein EHQ69_00850 [Leptospira congkakensis]TGL97822.1 hypothetical protein EHQ70_06505 [Leptospira congkakensis]